MSAVIVTLVFSFATAIGVARAKTSAPSSFRVVHLGAEQRRGCDPPDRSPAFYRRGIAGRRAATWHWQDVLELARTRTLYRERETKGCSYLRWLKQLWAGRAHVHWQLFASLTDPATAICFVFRRDCEAAVKVAYCESKLSTRARNGQYLGMFQMGAGERARYGHGDTPYEQARAAHRYFVASGRDWSPWQCRPSGLAW